MSPVVQMSENYTMENNSIPISWSHPSPDQVERFEIMVDGRPHGPVIQRSVNQIEIELSECRMYTIYVVAIDICNNNSSSNLKNIHCIPTSIDSTTIPTSTDSASTPTSSDSTNNSGKKLGM